MQDGYVTMTTTSTLMVDGGGKDFHDDDDEEEEEEEDPGTTFQRIVSSSSEASIGMLRQECQELLQCRLKSCSHERLHAHHGHTAQAQTCQSTSDHLQKVVLCQQFRSVQPRG